MDEASALPQLGPSCCCGIQEVGRERQILYCYVMNIFPLQPDSAERAVSSVQRLIIGHSTYQSWLYVVMSDHSDIQLSVWQETI